MNSLLEKENLTKEDINKLIDNKVEESIHLDFKEAESLDMKDKKKAEIAKDVSAFANSAGGYIVYGIKEENHVASSYSFINGSVYTKEWLEQIVQSRIQRKIEGLKVIPVRIDDEIKKSIYVVKIPESSAAPHMTSDKRFYKRYNFESVQMEEYEIRACYNRKEKTDLVINNVVQSKDPEFEYENEEKYVFIDLGFQVENIGKVIERDYKVRVSLNFNDYIVKFNGSEPRISHSLIGDDGDRAITFFNNCPIFPEEVWTIGNGRFGFPMAKLVELSSYATLTVELLFPNGKDGWDIELKDILDNYGLI